MDKFHAHRPDCPFSFAPLDVCDCVEKNLRDRIKADAKRIERGVNAELLDQQQAMQARIAELEDAGRKLLANWQTEEQARTAVEARIAELEAERDEALRQRDAWKARALFLAVETGQ